MKVLGRRLLSIRRTVAGLNQAEFAARLGYPKRTYVGWELGEREPSVFLPLALMREFQIDPAWVLAGPEDEPRSVTNRMNRQVEEADRVLARLKTEQAAMDEQEVTASRIAVVALLTQLVDTMHLAARHVAEAAEALAGVPRMQDDL